VNRQNICESRKKISAFLCGLPISFYQVRIILELENGPRGITSFFNEPVGNKEGGQVNGSNKYNFPIIFRLSGVEMAWTTARQSLIFKFKIPYM
jgi:hypothetical protein